MTRSEAQKMNHTQKGESCTVFPIRTLEDIAKIKALLKDNPRDYAMFIVGINTNLRASDILRLKVGQVQDLKVGDHFPMREKKTGNRRFVTLNKAVYDAIQPLLDAPSDFPLFRNVRDGKPLSVCYLNVLVKSWCKSVGIKENCGSHTLRKTFGRIHYSVFKTPLALLVDMFGHSSQRQTLAYIGIQEHEVKEAFLREI